MITKRSFRVAMSKEEAIQAMKGNVGKYDKKYLAKNSCLGSSNPDNLEKKCYFYN